MPPSISPRPWGWSDDWVGAAYMLKLYLPTPVGMVRFLAGDSGGSDCISPRPWGWSATPSTVPWAFGLRYLPTPVGMVRIGQGTITGESATYLPTPVGMVRASVFAVGCGRLVSPHARGDGPHFPAACRFSAYCISPRPWGWSGGTGISDLTITGVSPHARGDGPWNSWA